MPKLPISRRKTRFSGRSFCHSHIRLFPPHAFKDDLSDRIRYRARVIRDYVEGWLFCYPDSGGIRRGIRGNYNGCYEFFSKILCGFETVTSLRRSDFDMAVLSCYNDRQDDCFDFAQFKEEGFAPRFG